MTPRMVLAEGVAGFASAVARTRRELDDYLTPLVGVAVAVDGTEGQIRITGSIGENPIAHCFATPFVARFNGTEGLSLALVAWSITAAQAASVRPPRYMN